MLRERRIHILIILLIILSNIGCDQVSKHLVRDHVEYQEYIPIFQNHVTLTKVENSGAFLSMGDQLGDPYRFILLTLFPTLVLLGGLGWLVSRRDLPFLAVLATGFILGGGIGNLYDRIRFGSVTDFLHIDFGLFQTGIFNLADVSIMTGLGIFLVQTVAQGRVQS